MNYTLKLLLAATLSLSLSACSALPGKALVGKDPGAVRMYRLEDGSTTGLVDFRGKHTAIIFWSTTCRSSNPMLQRLGEFARKNRGNKKIQLIAVSLDKNEDLTAVKERILYERLDHMEHMFSGNEDLDEAFTALKGDRLPYVVVVDPAGRVVAVDTDDDIVYDYLK